MKKQEILENTVFPILRKMIDLNPNLEQTEGY